MDEYNESRKKSVRKWQKSHREKTRILAKEYYWKNRDAVNERRRKNPNSLFHTIRRNARYRNLSFNLDKKEFIDWWNKQKQECFYCSIPVGRFAIADLGKKLAKRLSIDRLNNKEGYKISNLVLACLRCNFIKSNLLTSKEMKEIGQKYLKPKWKNQK